MDTNNDLYKKIIELAFEKAAKNIVRKSLKAKTDYLEANILKGCNAKTYERYYKKYVTKTGNDFENPSEVVLDGLAVFIGYQSFLHFKIENSKLVIEKINEASKEIQLPSSNKIVDTPLKAINNNPTKLLKAVFISFILISIFVGVWIVNDLFFKKTPQPQPTTVVYNTYNGNLNYYYYQKDNGELLLFKNKGEINNEPLMPATKQVMLTYFKQQNVAVSKEDEKRWFKEPTDVQKLEGKTDIPPVKIAEEIQEEIVDKNKTKTVNRFKATSIIAIKNENGLDTDISAFFRNNYKKPTENYNVMGTISYNFNESSFSKNLIVCNLHLNFIVKLNSSDSIFEENTITISATGFSNADAKKNAIKKIQFN